VTGKYQAGSTGLVLLQNREILKACIMGVGVWTNPSLQKNWKLTQNLLVKNLFFVMKEKIWSFKENDPLSNSLRHPRLKQSKEELI
jgi:hypothetical protein